jgi:hypothetical protein
VFGPPLSSPLGATALKATEALVPSSSARPLHPSVKYLNQRTTAVSAKFRSMIPGTIKIWFENGAGGSFQGSLGLGKEYTLNTYEGHEFFFTNEEKSKEFGRFKMRKEQVLYVVADPSYPPPTALVLHNEKEQAFMQEYLQRTGLQWRHFYGPNGPRGPPSLFMWPAAHIGQTHSVTSSEGYWCESVF